MRLGFAIEHRFLPVELRLVRERRLQAGGGKTAADAPHGGQTGARLLANDYIRSRPVWLGGIGQQKDTRMSAVALGRLPGRDHSLEAVAIGGGAGALIFFGSGEAPGGAAGGPPGGPPRSPLFDLPF